MKVQFSPDDFPSEERKAEWQDMIDSLQEYAKRDLNSWERDFLAGVDTFLSSNGFLTRGQREKLEALHAEHLG